MKGSRSRRSLGSVGLGIAGLAMLSLLMMTGCANLASFQTAETLDADEGKGGGGVTWTRYNLEGFGFEEEDDPTITIPAVAGWYRRGITDDFEVNGMIWMPFGAKLGGKYQLAGAKGQTGGQLAVGAHAGYLQVTGESSDTEDNAVSIIDAYAPVYLGYRVASGLAMYVTPQYILRIITGDNSDVGHTVSASVGAAFGESTQFHLEATPGYDLTAEDVVMNFGIGVTF